MCCWGWVYRRGGLRGSFGECRGSRSPGLRTDLGDEWAHSADRLQQSAAAAFLWGLSTVMLRPAIVHLTSVQANSVRMPLVSVILFLVWWWTRLRGCLREMGLRALTIVAATGIAGMGVGSMLFLTAIRLAGPAKTATLASSSLVFGMAMAVAFLKEELTLRLVLGVLLCVSGVWLVT